MLHINFFLRFSSLQFQVPRFLSPVCFCYPLFGEEVEEEGKVEDGAEKRESHTHTNSE